MYQYLAGGESPRLAQHFLQKRRLYVEVLGDHKEREEMTIYAAACHCIAIAFLMRFGCGDQQRNLLGFLRKMTRHKQW